MDPPLLLLEILGAVKEALVLDELSEIVPRRMRGEALAECLKTLQKVEYCASNEAGAYRITAKGRQALERISERGGTFTFEDALAWLDFYEGDGEET